MEYIFLEIWRFEKHIALSEKKPPLEPSRLTCLALIEGAMLNKEMFIIHILKITIKQEPDTEWQKIH